MRLTADRQAEPNLDFAVVSPQGDMWMLARLRAAPEAGFTGSLTIEVNPGSVAPGDGAVTALRIDERGRLNVTGAVNAAAYEQGGRPLVASRWSEIPGGITFESGDVTSGATAPRCFGADRGEKAASDAVPVALSGRVPCKVTDEGGPTRRGDLLTPSSALGRAMRALRVLMEGRPVCPSGTVIGKVLEPHGTGQGTIDVFVTTR